MDLSIIIVNYKTKDITADCIRAVLKSKTNYSYEIILVDNASNDGSLEYLQQEFPQVKFIARKDNGGFAVANNRGAAEAVGTYVWLLNSDTVVFEDTIETLMNSVRKKDALISSCRLLNADKTLQTQGGALPNFWNITLWMLNLDALPVMTKLVPPYQEYRESVYEHDHLIGWLGGTALLVRRDVYQAMGGLDEYIFMYGEDVEFCLRAARQKIDIHYYAKPKLIHLGQKSGSHERSIVGEFQGLKYIYKKHKTQIEYNWLRVMLKIGAALRVIMYGLTGKPQHRKTYEKAFNMA